jgi:hypothetical protein
MRGILRSFRESPILDKSERRYWINWLLVDGWKTIRTGSNVRRGLGSYSGSVEIPLNPPLLKGDFDSPLRKRGVGGIFILRGPDSIRDPVM